MHDRLPRILTTRVDFLSRFKEELVAQYGEAARDEIKQVIGGIGQLRYEVQTDKEFTLFEETTPEFKQWNEFINWIEGIGGRKSYFTTPWLHSECMVYRKLKLIFEQTTLLKDFDYFKDQKDHTLVSTLSSIQSIATFLDRTTVTTEKERHDRFINILKLNMWSNRCDLSVTGGDDMDLVEDPFVRIPFLNEFILADHTQEIWSCLVEKGGDCEVAIICDNSGYELFTDFIMADTLIHLKLAKRVTLHLKAIPWFVSDAIESDCDYLMNFLETHSFEALHKMGKRLRQRITDGQLAIHKPFDHFWVSGYEFAKMHDVDPELYQRLGKYQLLIFKGDLNYRKLVSDHNWEPTTPFKTALKGFQPTNLCALRTVKADTVCGIKPGVAEKLRALNEQWMRDGDYGVIQFASK